MTRCICLEVRGDLGHLYQPNPKILKILILHSRANTCLLIKIFTVSQKSNYLKFLGFLKIIPEVHSNGDSSGAIVVVVGNVGAGEEGVGSLFPEMISRKVCSLNPSFKYDIKIGPKSANQGAKALESCVPTKISKGSLSGCKSLNISVLNPR